MNRPTQTAKVHTCSFSAAPRGGVAGRPALCGASESGAVRGQGPGVRTPGGSQDVRLEGEAGPLPRAVPLTASLSTWSPPPRGPVTAARRTSAHPSLLPGALDHGFWAPAVLLVTQGGIAGRSERARDLPKVTQRVTGRAGGRRARAQGEDAGSAVSKRPSPWRDQALRAKQPPAPLPAEHALPPPGELRQAQRPQARRWVGLRLGAGVWGKRPDSLAHALCARSPRRRALVCAEPAPLAQAPPSWPARSPTRPRPRGTGPASHAPRAPQGRPGQPAEGRGGGVGRGLCRGGGAPLSVPFRRG